MSDYSNAAEIAIQNRKFAKTCVEKKRRDRINKCLDELKDLMSQSDDKARYQKMEKAEILEMAVEYMRNIRLANPNSSFFTNADANDLTTNNTNNNTIDQSNDSNQYYTQAYRQCLSEFQNILCVVPGLQDDVKNSIMNHMTQRYIEVENVSSQVSMYSAQDKIKKTKLPRHSPYNLNKNSPMKQKNKKQLGSNYQNDEMSIVTNNEQNNLTASSDSSACSPYLYHQTSKFGGSCSSLDSYNFTNNLNVPPALSPALSIGSDQNNSSNGSINSSPASSQCSSPISSSSKNPFISSANSLKSINKLNANAAFNFANYEMFQNASYLKMWRPW